MVAGRNGGAVEGHLGMHRRAAALTAVHHLHARAQSAVDDRAGYPHLFQLIWGYGKDVAIEDGQIVIEPFDRANLRTRRT